MSHFHRPGRFDRLIEVPLPDCVTRSAIFNVHLHGLPCEFDLQASPQVEHQRLFSEHFPLQSEASTYLQLLAQATDGLSGADIEAVCREGAILALRRDIQSGVISFTDIWTSVLQSGEAVKVV